jgi:hypothetical protein
MNSRALSAYEEWTVADGKARDAETLLANAWRAYFDGRGPPPEEELIHEVGRLRVAANERLSMAMAAIGAAKGGGQLSR